MKYILNFIIFFLFNFSLVFSQTNGYVFDELGKPIKDVKVYLTDLEIHNYTNSDGLFNFSSDAPINSFFEFEKMGYSLKLFRYTGIR